MFNKNQKREVGDQTADTMVGSGTFMEGKLVVEGSLLIDGRLEGNLTVRGFLTVGPAADIRADIEAGEARVAGKIRGNLKARESVELLPGSRLEGDVFTKCFRIEDGAFFQGNCHMGEAWLDQDGKG
jgi:cytoskeletal protein CcmA (bactofilin family)